MKTKQYHFDVEMIIDHEFVLIGKEKVKVATHRMFRNLSLVDVVDKIRNEDVPVDEPLNITFNIRGTNY